MNLDLSLQLFGTSEHKWLSLSPLWIATGLAVHGVVEGICICVSDDFCQYFGGFIVHFPDIEDISEVDSDFFVSRILEICMDLC